MSAKMHPAFKYEVEITAVYDGKVHFTLTCRECGGTDQTIRDRSPTDVSGVYCAACGVAFGSVTRIQLAASSLARQDGHTVDFTKWIGKGLTPKAS